MNKLVATIHYTTTDSDTEVHERVIADALSGHGLEITDVHCDEASDKPEWIQDAA